MTAYLEWKEEWLNATEWETIGDPSDPRPCQHPPPLTPEDAFAFDFFRWNCRNATVRNFGMMPTLIGAIGIARRASLEVLMIKLDKIGESEARIAELKKPKGGE